MWDSVGAREEEVVQGELAEGSAEGRQWDDSALLRGTQIACLSHGDAD